MKLPANVTIGEYIDQHAFEAYCRCFVVDDKYLKDLKDFCNTYGYDFEHAFEILDELGLLDDKKFKPNQQLIDYGIYETILMKDKLQGKVIFRNRTFITFRGAFFLELILEDQGCKQYQD